MKLFHGRNHHFCHAWTLTFKGHYQLARKRKKRRFWVFWVNDYIPYFNYGRQIITKFCFFSKLLFKYLNILVDIVDIVETVTWTIQNHSNQCQYWSRQQVLILASVLHCNSKQLKLRKQVLLFCAIFFTIWKQNLPLKWNVFLPDVCQLLSREHQQYVHLTEREFYSTNCNKFFRRMWLTQ